MDKLKIIARESDYVVCVKPAGVLSEGEMPRLIADTLGLNTTVYVVHRLDRETGGLMLYALTAKAAARLSQGFSKEYLAAVRGIPEPNGEMRDLLFYDKTKNKAFAVKRLRHGVKEAELAYSLLEAENGLSLVRIELKTGRTHQIRVQFSSRGMPLFGDGKYGGRTEKSGLALWSYKITVGDKVYECLPKGEPWQYFDYFKAKD